MPRLNAEETGAQVSTPAEFAERASRYYQDYRPQAYDQIQDPVAFFRSLGERIADQVDEAARQIEGPSPVGEDYLARVGRINMARMQAAELVMDNEVYSTPSEMEVEDDDEDAVTPATAAMVAYIQEGHQLMREVNEELSQIRMDRDYRELRRRREMHPEP